MRVKLRKNVTKFKTFNCSASTRWFRSTLLLNHLNGVLRQSERLLLCYTVVYVGLFVRCWLVMPDNFKLFAKMRMSANTQLFVGRSYSCNKKKAHNVKCFPFPFKLHCISSAIVKVCFQTIIQCTCRL